MEDHAQGGEGVKSHNRLMSNVIGTKSSKRSLLCRSSQCFSMVHKCERMQLISPKFLSQVQRRGAVRVVSAFRTVSEAAELVITGVTSIDSFSKER